MDTESLHSPRVNEKTSNTYWGSLLVYCVYRIIIAISLLILFAFQTHFSAEVRFVEPTAWYSSDVVALVYLLLCVAAFIFRLKRWPSFMWQVMFAVMIDIIAFVTLIHFNPLMLLSLGIFIDITIVAASIITAGRTSLFVAALATVMLLIEHVYAGWSYGVEHLNYLQVATICLTFFATAILGHMMSRKLRFSDRLASERADEIEKLERLNQHIIQRMLVGIIAVDDDENISLINNTAKKMLKLGEIPVVVLADVDAELSAMTKRWKRYYVQESAAVEIGTERVECNVQFASGGSEENRMTLIFLEDSARAAQQAQQLKLASLGRLTASIAHEIRNPLSSISHAAELLQDAESLTAQDEKLLAMIQKNSKRIDHTISNILQLSRRKQTTTERVDLCQWLPEYISEVMEIKSNDWQIDFQCPDEPTYVQLNKSQFNQILSNLCENGMRYSEEKTGLASLQLRLCCEKPDNQIYVDIIDDGAGVEKNKEESIFEPFFTTEQQGTGLGLYVARELSEANNAKLIYQRTDEGKSRFRIMFMSREN
tara:strand:- start:13131 stop:14753 length:1623 start_codon:yes stop_codon:yes gene_type:complete